MSTSAGGKMVTPAGALAGADVASAGFAGTGFAGVDFAGTGFAGTGFAGTGFAGTGFAGVDFTDAFFRVDEVSGARFRGAGFVEVERGLVARGEAFEAPMKRARTVRGYARQPARRSVNRRGARSTGEAL
ncbi:hypothetical protein [Chondromyces apiculatus]|uniref:hypothetical protein n=1 Tax=Chondromyces apiculatus TaxID=51 RepID=UPI0012DD922C|nr:hypothetical protein [Chondromyces apiculatus]